MGGYIYGWDCSKVGGPRDRSGLGTVESTLIMPIASYAADCSSDEWKFVLPNGRYNVELGFSDIESGIDTSGCMLQGISANVGYLQPGEKDSVLININVVDRLVTFSGKYMDGCDSVSYITIRSGWDLGFELGVENGNECNTGSLSIVDEEECIAAAEAMEFSFMSSYDVLSNPKGCHLLPGAGVYFNTHDVGMAHWGYTPICKNIGFDYGMENGNACNAGAVPVVTQEGCLDASRAFGLSFENTENQPFNPKGCHWLPGVGFYFNSHETGSAHWGYTPICRTVEYPSFALIDGAPGSCDEVAEIVNPDPEAQIGEVQCCRNGNECTRRNPATSNDNNDCITGNNDDLKYSFQDAMDACASLGTGWSLCTREETASALCLGKGCWHDCAHVWVLDPQVDEALHLSSLNLAVEEH
eukprot:TRINITY_DN97_c0_g1_i12.p1 TRINITY_DN97_c0_g1~~TRINITY_DN97_c0_g1_i12.p1  ORF type:complete len:414 (-),score=57.99 TRINITY_DN97_c0_g1_i12:55-1296(-)